MLTLKAKKRKSIGKRIKSLRRKNILPAVIYGPKIKSVPLELDYKIFEKVYDEAGESSLLNLRIEGEKNEYTVLIHDVKKDPLSDRFIHADFYQPPFDKEIEASVPLVFKGESLAVKDLGGTLVRNIQEIEVKALPKDLPHEIEVNIEGLKTFEDEIFIKDLNLPQGVRIDREAGEVIALVAPPEKVEEELAKPIEEKVEEVEAVEKEEGEEREEEGGEKEKEEKRE